MILVVTNSRRFAIEKLMARYGLRPPFPFVRFIESTDELLSATRNQQEWDSLPGILIWQRGRMSSDAADLRAVAGTFFNSGSLRAPTQQELDP